MLLFTGTSVTIFLKTWEIGMEVNRMRKAMAWLLIGVILLFAGCATQAEEQAEMVQAYDDSVFYRMETVSKRYNEESYGRRKQQKPCSLSKIQATHF